MSDYFISRQNRVGVFYLLVLSLIIIYTPRVLLFFLPKEEIIVDEKKVQFLQKKNYTPVYKKKKSKKKKKYAIPTSKFNPNTYSISDWQKLGLSKKQAISIVNFSKRGLYSNEDLKKIYVLPNKLYELIKDSTIYPSIVKQKPTTKIYENEIIETKPILLELNTASKEELLNINGIGPYFAKKIIEYKNNLGGYLFKEQLLEFWKMDAEKFLRIESSIFVDSTKIKKISLNHISVDSLKKHPYLNWNQSNSIIKIRNQKGSYKNIHEIKESVLITNECFEKIKAYLSL